MQKFKTKFKFYLLFKPKANIRQNEEACDRSFANLLLLYGALGQHSGYVFEISEPLSFFFVMLQVVCSHFTFQRILSFGVSHFMEFIAQTNVVIYLQKWYIHEEGKFIMKKMRISSKIATNFVKQKLNSKVSWKTVYWWINIMLKSIIITLLISC